MSHKWCDIGELLGITSGRLEGIHSQRMGDVRLCCRDVLLDWIEKEEASYPANWDGLVVLLQHLELNNLVSRLKSVLESLKKQTSR